MREYRVYVLNAGGHVDAPARIITHTDDDAAIQHARQLLDGHDIELWDGPRLVIRLEHRHPGK